MLKLFEPKPLRKVLAWKHYAAIIASDPAPLAIERMKEASIITCRDCFGFGHTAKKCPTGKKLDIHR